MNRNNNSFQSRTFFTYLQECINTLMHDGVPDVQEMKRTLNLARDHMNLFPSIDLVICISNIAEIVTRQHEFDQSVLQDFLNAWIGAATSRLGTFDNQQLVDSISALAQLNYHNRAFESAWLNAAVFKLGGFNSQQLVASISALNSLYHPDDFELMEWKLFEGIWIDAAVHYKLNCFTYQELEISKKALAHLDHANDVETALWRNNVNRRLDELRDSNTHGEQEPVDVIGAEMPAEPDV